MAKPLKLAAAMIVVSVLTVRAQPVSIQLESGSFRLKGWNAPSTPPSQGWSSIFRVYAGTGDVPPLLGSYTVEAGSLVFRPGFPMARGVHYRAVFTPPSGGPSIERLFDGPPRETVPSAHIDCIYPSTSILPSNQLRLYVYFSAPMSRGEADRRIHVVNESGQILPNVLLPGEELWDADFRRLTLTFDPGRIKRGLTSNQNLGPPIVEGKHYSLVVDRGWPDARGVAMTSGFQKTFRGGPAERTAPNPDQWRIVAPPAGSTGPLIIDFPKPMNYPLLQRMLWVVGAGGNIAGTVKVDRQETEWRFNPAQPWNRGEYKIVVDTSLEDLAGNHIGQLFDIDVFRHVTAHITGKTISLPFKVQ